MQLGESFKVALGSLRGHKVRSFLTMLGIIIGVSSVITVLAMGRRAEKATKEEIQKYGTNLLTIRPDFGRGHRAKASGQRVRLYNEDAGDLARINGVTAVVPEISSYAPLKFGNEVTYARIYGTTPEYEWVRNAPLIEGRYFTRSENASRARIAVIGAEIKTMLFGEEIPSVLGSEIKIRGINFEVIGVLKEKGPGWSSPDEAVLVPLETAQKRLFGENYLHGITVKVADMDLMTPVSLEIEEVLRRNHRLTGNDENDFRIYNQVDFIETSQTVTETFKWLLGSIAGVSLIVGGIGIMNIMLVSVTERTREIGIRRALGAKRRDITTQFLFETVVLSSTGGMLGIFVGVAIPILVTVAAGIKTALSLWAVLLAFGISVGIGIVFGLYPARRAAIMDPIEALRHE
jgi:putative ABC transport system permease protein